MRALYNVLFLIALINFTGFTNSQNCDQYFIDKNYKLIKIEGGKIISDLKSYAPIKAYKFFNDSLFFYKEKSVNYYYDSLNYTALPHRFVYSVNINNGLIQLSHEEIFIKDSLIKKVIRKSKRDSIIFPNLSYGEGTIYSFQGITVIEHDFQNIESTKDDRRNVYCNRGFLIFVNGDKFDTLLKAETINHKYYFEKAVFSSAGDKIIALDMWKFRTTSVVIDINTKNVDSIYYDIVIERQCCKINSYISYINNNENKYSDYLLFNAKTNERRKIGQGFFAFCSQH